MCTLKQGVNLKAVSDFICASISASLTVGSKRSLDLNFFPKEASEEFGEGNFKCFSLAKEKKRFQGNFHSGDHS